jgi:N-methylhydantoinase A
MTLVAFGGAGPLHAVEVGRTLGVRDVLIPPYPGISAAMGLLVTDIKYDRLATQFMLQGEVDLDALGGDLDRIEREIRHQLDRDGVAPADIRVERSLDCRYIGQGYELNLPLAPGGLGPVELDGIWAAMHERHRLEYGHAFPGNAIEIVNARVTGIGATPRIASFPVRGERSLDAALVASESVAFRNGDGTIRHETAFYERARLPVDERVEGPAVILQTDTTTLLAPGSSARLDEAGNLRVTPPED